ncbi:MAG: alpha/beta hydrolase family protein, partial [Gaiellales bacterium]
DTIQAPIDRARRVVMGHSAGGQLALWAAGTGSVSAAVSLGGVCDLTAAARAGLGDGAATEFAGGTPEQRPEAYERADPLRRVPIGVPVLLVHGDADDRVPIEHSRRYARLAQHFADPCELVELPEIGHFELIDPRTDAWAESVLHLDTLLGPHANRGAAA